MGYYSTVVIAVNKGCYLASLLSNDLPTLFKENNPVPYNNAMYWRFSDYKWYDSYESISNVMDYLNNLSLDSREAFGFIRIGEESTDIEELGDPSEYDISVNISIEAIV